MPTTNDPRILSGRGVLARTEGPPARLPAAEAPPAVANIGVPILGGWSVTLTVPCRVRSEMNQRDGWRARRKRFQAQTAALLAAKAGAPLSFPWDIAARGLAVTLTHVGRKMDSDNLAGAFKGMRDCLASLLHVDDGDALVEWVYDQRPGTPGVVVRIEPRAAGEGPA